MIKISIRALKDWSNLWMLKYPNKYPIGMFDLKFRHARDRRNFFASTPQISERLFPKFVQGQPKDCATREGAVNALRAKKYLKKKLGGFVEKIVWTTDQKLTFEIAVYVFIKRKQKPYKFILKDPMDDFFVCEES